ncbi:MAG: hypothetical protein WC080_02765 [Patescibacteria group bacterium]|jgi:hypothetical protein
MRTNEENLSLNDILLRIEAIYQVPDDRLYSVEDLLYNHQRFLTAYMEEQNKNRLPEAFNNMMVSFAWLFAFVNRFHIDLPENLWKRYSYKCPFCLEIPCICNELEPQKSQKTGRPPSRKPQDISEWQEILLKIYPVSKVKNYHLKLRSKFEELMSAFRAFVREKRKSRFREIEILTADYFVMLLRIFNYFKIDFKDEFLAMFKDGCHVCKKTPCECNYFE